MNESEFRAYMAAQAYTAAEREIWFFHPLPGWCRSYIEHTAHIAAHNQWARTERNRKLRNAKRRRKEERMLAQENWRKFVVKITEEVRIRERNRALARASGGSYEQAYCLAL